MKDFSTGWRVVFLTYASVGCFLVALTAGFSINSLVPVRRLRDYQNNDDIYRGRTEPSLLFSAKQQRRGKGKGKAKTRSEPIFISPDDAPSILPKLLVFDLDNTLWTPELYQIRQRSVPKAGKEIWLFDCARDIVHDLATNPLWSEGGGGGGGGGVGRKTQLAIASRTNKVDWADKLLRQFEAAPGVSLDDLFAHKEIVPGSKRRHFESLREKTGVRFGDMVFFDDDIHMNLGEISQMGVLCCHCPRGITRDLFRGTLMRYHEMKAQHADQLMGITLTLADLGVEEEREREERDASFTEDRRRTVGTIKFFSAAKRFGFVVEDGNSGSEFFFHESKVANGLIPGTGLRVEFETIGDSRGRPAAAILSALTDQGDYQASKNYKSEISGTEMIQMPCFSMSQPFVSLLLNGIKTIETRNNPMFMGIKPGTKVLLHCGMRDWKDSEAPRIELRKAGYSEEEIDRVCALPPGYTKGCVLGVVEIGRTWLTAERERRGPNMQLRVVAKTENVEKYATIIESASWLKRPVKMRGFPGIQTIEVPSGLLPN